MLNSFKETMEFPFGRVLLQVNKPAAGSVNILDLPHYAGNIVNTKNAMMTPFYLTVKELSTTGIDPMLAANAIITEMVKVLRKKTDAEFSDNDLNVTEVEYALSAPTHQSSHAYPHNNYAHPFGTAIGNADANITALARELIPAAVLMSGKDFPLLVTSHGVVDNQFQIGVSMNLGNAVQFIAEHPLATNETDFNPNINFSPASSRYKGVIKFDAMLFGVNTAPTKFQLIRRGPFAGVLFDMLNLTDAAEKISEALKEKAPFLEILELLQFTPDMLSDWQNPQAANYFNPYQNNR